MSCGFRFSGCKYCPLLIHLCSCRCLRSFCWSGLCRLSAVCQSEDLEEEVGGLLSRRALVSLPPSTPVLPCSSPLDLVLGAAKGFQVGALDAPTPSAGTCSPRPSKCVLPPCVRALKLTTHSQPPLISLFSSTSSHPLLLASTSTSESLTADSFISLLFDATDSDETLLLWHGGTGSSRELKGKGKDVPRGNLRSRVLHLQSPDVRSTKVVWRDLGLQLPYLHFALKDLSQLFFLEVDLVDSHSTPLRLRLSTFQVPSLPSSPRSLTLSTERTARLPLPLSSPPPPPSPLPPGVPARPNSLDDPHPPPPSPPRKLRLRPLCESRIAEKSRRVQEFGEGGGACEC